MCYISSSLRVHQQLVRKHNAFLRAFSGLREPHF